jgi:hypothetical protein
MTNHTITPEQYDQLKESWGITVIHELPETLSNKFRDVPVDKINFRSYAEPFINWASAFKLKNDEPIWIQGEPGLTFTLVQGLKSKGLTIIHASTPRIVSESEGIKKSIFRHCTFRKYQDF